jgi:hypothetical protein
MNKNDERQLWRTIELIFEHFEQKPSHTRREIAQGLGNVHHNTIYKDELLLIEWCEPYAKSVKRRQRLKLYQVWLLAICRVIVSNFGKDEAIAFFFTNSDRLTLENFNKFRRHKDDRASKAKCIHAA